MQTGYTSSIDDMLMYPEERHHQEGADQIAIDHETLTFVIKEQP